MKAKKSLFFGVAIVIVGLIVLVSCDSGTDSDTEIKIGVNQYVTHEIFDAVYAGFKETLKADGREIEIVFKNSNADAMTCHQINQQFVNSDIDVIVALGTPVAQSAINVAGEKVPVVFGCIMDPVGSKLADSLDKPGGNKTGSTNAWPFAKQISLIKKMLPGVVKIGMVTSPGESNCVSGMKIVREAAKEQGIELIEVPITNSGEITAAVKRLINEPVGAIMVSPSSAAFSALDATISLAHANGIAVIGGDETAVEKGSIATYGFSNKQVGVATAEVVLRVLDGERPGDIPVARPKDMDLYFNEDSMKKFNVSMPEGL